MEDLVFSSVWILCICIIILFHLEIPYEDLLEMCMWTSLKMRVRQSFRTIYERKNYADDGPEKPYRYPFGANKETDHYAADMEDSRNVITREDGDFAFVCFQQAMQHCKGQAELFCTMFGK
ncbi:conserved hypothetical protein [Ricinus communis]|uniref:Uncharacterized protein n=1 Tax=Ricinus communis TaxID=3988 RepID=B9RNL8_RICCO|nr:conserved hypothetical protein [Ricinus communis]